MATVGIFFGSDTGNTEHIAKMIQKELGKHLFDIRDIAKSSKEEDCKAKASSTPPAPPPTTSM